LILAALETTYDGQTVDFMLTPFMNQLALPLTMGRTWSNTLNLDEEISVPEGDIRIQLTATMDSEIDAYGTVQVPVGDFECLRVKNHVVYDLTVSYWLLFTWVPLYEDQGDGISYDWRAENVGNVLNVTGQTNDPNFAFAKSLRRMMNYTLTETAGEIADSMPLSAPESFELLGNYPNPFNNETVISYQLNSPADITIRILDITGRKVGQYDQGYQSEGLYDLHWTPDAIAAGIYIVRLETGEQVQNHMMVYIK